MKYSLDVVDKQLNVRLRACRRCGEVTLHGKLAVRHWLHLGLSILTGGVWMVVWVILVARAYGDLQTCLVCGHRDFR